MTCQVRILTTLLLLSFYTQANLLYSHDFGAFSLLGEKKGLQCVPLNASLYFFKGKIDCLPLAHFPSMLVKSYAIFVAPKFYAFVHLDIIHKTHQLHVFKYLLKGMQNNGEHRRDIDLYKYIVINTRCIWKLKACFVLNLKQVDSKEHLIFRSLIWFLYIGYWRVW